MFRTENRLRNETKQVTMQRSSEKIEILKPGRLTADRRGKGGRSGAPLARSEVREIPGVPCQSTCWMRPALFGSFCHLSPTIGWPPRPCRFAASARRRPNDQISSHGAVLSPLQPTQIPNQFPDALTIGVKWAPLGRRQTLP